MKTANNKLPLPQPASAPPKSLQKSDLENSRSFENENSEVETLDSDWLRVFYAEVGREVTLARESQRETHNWIIAVAGGIITAAWALSNAESFYPSEKSLLLVILMVPLIFRFFVRSCLEYQIFNRWSSLRNALDDYYFTKTIHKELNNTAMESLIEQIRLYYFQWKQPKPFGKMLKDNLNLAYAWPFILIIG